MHVRGEWSMKNRESNAPALIMFQTNVPNGALMTAERKGPHSEIRLEQARELLQALKRSYDSLSHEHRGVIREHFVASASR